MSGGNHGPVIIAVLSEATRKFGRVTDQNRDQVASWVRRRLNQLQGRTATITPFVPRDFDAKARSAGDE